MVDCKTKLDLSLVFKSSFSYWKNNNKDMLIFSLINFLFLFAGLFFVGGMSSPFFLVWAACYYIFWSYFFRFVFDKKPYYVTSTFAKSLVPSTKIFIFTILVTLLIVSFPWLVSLVAIPLNLSDNYIELMDKYVQFLENDKDGVELLLSFVFIFTSPIVFFRPFFAWISSILGRSGSMKVAFSRTKHNYWQFFMLGIIMNASFIILKTFSGLIALVFPDYAREAMTTAILFAISSPLVVYYNIVVAKGYGVFFLDKVANSN